MAFRKTSRPTPVLGPEDVDAAAIPRLYPEDIEQTGQVGGPFTLRPGHAAAHPEASKSPPLEFPPDPPTVRGHTLETTARDELSITDEIPNLAPGEDGTSTDQTALMVDRSVRRGSRATLTVLTGLNAGQVIALDGTALEGNAMTLGRGKEATVVMRDPGVSRLHASIKAGSNGAFDLLDLRSTNGVRVNGVRVKTHTLQVGDRVQLGPDLVLQFSYLDDTEKALNKSLYEAATRDPLTQALNRRAFDERLEAEFAFARRHRTMLAIILCDIDHFKQVNDKYGHPVGDRVLQQLAQAVLRTIRAEDVFARYGGEEFVVLVRGDNRDQTKRLGERLRLAVAQLPFKDDKGQPFRVTLSAGFAMFDEGPSPAALVLLADQRLYRAKHSGRNQICGD